MTTAMLPSPRACTVRSQSTHGYRACTGRREPRPLAVLVLTPCRSNPVTGTTQSPGQPSHRDHSVTGSTRSPDAPANSVHRLHRHPTPVVEVLAIVPGSCSHIQTSVARRNCGMSQLADHISWRATAPPSYTG